MYIPYPIMTESIENVTGQRHDRTALILYGSETGNSQDVAEELGRVAERIHFQTVVCEMDQVNIVWPCSPSEETFMSLSMSQTQLLILAPDRTPYWTTPLFSLPSRPPAKANFRKMQGSSGKASCESVCLPDVWIT
jgi:sulfite reductase alpha subunit-like flavoprotein